VNKKSIVSLSAALLIGVSLSGCSWIRSINPWASDEPAAEKVAQADVTASDATPPAPMRVAHNDGHTHSHVQDSSGKTVTSGYGDCVNVGANLGDRDHNADCDKQGLKPATDAAPAAREEMAKPADEPMPKPAPEPAPTAQLPPAPMPAKPAPLKEDGGGAPGIVQDNADAGKPTVAVKPSQEKPTVAPSYEKISLQGDALFRFGKSDEGSILPLGIDKLNNLAAQLAAYDRASIDSITVVGHADRLGKKVPNQALSERRAMTVKKYLVKQGVDGAVIKSTGKGSSQPVKECKGKKKTPALVACLEPNRRVEVVIRGVKGK
jgi:outer membrane protein OmpA-like peptidoglycan-associated protein